MTYVTLRKNDFSEPSLKSQALAAYEKARGSKNNFERQAILSGRIDVLCHEVGYRFDSFHSELTKFQRKNKTSLQLAPRGWGKSTIGTICSSAIKILTNRDIRILFASETVTQSKDFLEELKGILTHSRVVELFGEVAGDVWNEDAITVTGRRFHRKEKTVMTTGVDGSVTSKHFDVIYADDLVTLKNSRTEGGRDKVFQWFYMTLMPCVTDNQTEFHVLGTTYHPRDLYRYLMDKDPKFKGHTQLVPAIRPDTGESNNPEVYSTEWLMEQRESMGHIYFNSQYNQDPASIQGTVFDDKFFRYVDFFPQDMVCFTGVDLAIGTKDRDAKFAICTIGVCPRTRNIYLVKYRAARLSLEGQNQLIDEHYTEVQPVKIGIEANAFQASKIKSLRENPDYADIPAVPIYTDKDKLTRAQRMAVRYERGQIFHHRSEKNGEFEEHILAIPNGKFWDLFDAFDIAVRTAMTVGSTKTKRKKEPGIIQGDRPLIKRRSING